MKSLILAALVLLFPFAVLACPCGPDCNCKIARKEHRAVKRGVVVRVKAAQATHRAAPVRLKAKSKACPWCG